MSNVNEVEAIDRLLDLSGQCAVVTGGAAGIGAAIGARLAQAGAAVVVADLDEAKAEQTVDGIRSRGGTAIAMRLDVTDPDAQLRVARVVRHQHGRLDIWVNNAGIYALEPLLTASRTTWARTMAINLDGTHAGIRAAAQEMIHGARGGCIVNIGSIAGTRAGHPSLLAYAASKAGVLSLTANAAAALGPRGIRVVAVAPGVVLTDSMHDHLDNLASVGANSRSKAETLPLRRLAQPDDVARVVLFLVSGLASYITGAVIPVDGGDALGSGTPEFSDLTLGLDSS